MNSSVWVEKYRPTNLNEMILTEKNRKLLQSCIDKKTIPNLTIYSKEAGVGKTTIAKMLSNMFCDEEEILFINGSLNRNIDTIRNDMTDFVYKPTMSGNKKVIIIDEADGINPIAQNSLRGFIEEWSNECSFILTCNNVDKIIKPIISRCPKLNLSVTQENKKEIAKQVKDRCVHILRDNLIEFDETAIQEIIISYFPDIRQIINVLQRLSLQGEIKNNSLVKQDSILSNDSILDLENSIIDKDWNRMRIWAHSNVEVDNIYNILYENFVTKIDKKQIPEFIGIIGEYSYRSNLTMYKEINLTAFLTEFMEKFKFNV